MWDLTTALELAHKATGKGYSTYIRVYIMGWSQSQLTFVLSSGYQMVHWLGTIWLPWFFMHLFIVPDKQGFLMALGIFIVHGVL